MGTGEAGALAEAVRFAAEEDGERVFTGVVDEVCCGWDEDGARLSVSGRSMAALLLDNEALGCDYQTATLADILRDHVTPYGIQVGRTDRLPAVPDFSVAMGSSEWQALYHFCRYYGGVTPRFDRQGRLQVCAWQDGARRVLDEDAAVLELAWKEKRYGVLSEVLVRDKTRDQVQRVVHSGFARRGGQCRRVLTMPGRSSYQAMRYSGEYQLQRAAEGWHSVELMLPGHLPRLAGGAGGGKLEARRLPGALAGDGKRVRDGCEGRVYPADPGGRGGGRLNGGGTVWTRRRQHVDLKTGDEPGRTAGGGPGGCGEPAGRPGGRSAGRRAPSGARYSRPAAISGSPCGASGYWWSKPDPTGNSPARRGCAASVRGTWRPARWCSTAAAGRPASASATTA